MAADARLAYRAPDAARRMANAARNFLDGLGDAQRAAASFPFAGDERYLWNYVPHPRKGLRLMNMTRPQQQLALALFDAGLSVRGARQANGIMALEPLVREVEREQRVVTELFRDAELYWFSIFGDPDGRDPWAWRAGGHHLGLHFTVVERELVAASPLFFGADPAEVQHGARAGLRTLPEEEDLARALLRSFDPAQRSQALFSDVAPSDILTRNARRAEPSIIPAGLAYSAMSGEQRGGLVRLVRHYFDRCAAELSGSAWSRIEQAGLEAITFAWAGGQEPGRGHYYAIKGPTFVVEYDNTQNNANHIHTVWREYSGDWGEDLLAEHYAAAHSSPAGSSSPSAQS